MPDLSSRQSGTVTISSGSTATVSGLSSYVLANSILFATVRGGSDAPASSLLTWFKASTTSIQFDLSAAVVNNVVIEWELPEWDTEIDVEDLTDTIVSDGDTLAVTSVVTTDTFLVSSQNNVGSTFGADDCLRPFLTNSTTITQNIGAENIDEWRVQVVESTDFVVQHIASAPDSTGLTFTVTIPVSLAGAEAFMLWNKETGSSLGHSQGSYRGKINTDTECLFTRQNSAGDETIEVTTQVIEFADGALVQFVEPNIAGGNASATATLSPAVVIAESTSIVSGMQNLSMGENARAIDDFEDVYVTATLTTTTEVTVTRQTTSNANDPGVFVIHWDTAAVGGANPKGVFGLPVGGPMKRVVY